MDLNDVVVFERVVTEGSLTAAAGRLGQPKSSVSRSLARLEGDLGVRLLHRTTRRLQLTAEGETFLNRARPILTALDEAADRDREDKATLLDLADRLIVMDGGRVVADGPKQKVVTALQAGQMAAPGADPQRAFGAAVEQARVRQRHAREGERHDLLLDTAAADWQPAPPVIRSARIDGVHKFVAPGRSAVSSVLVCWRVSMRRPVKRARCPCASSSIPTCRPTAKRPSGTPTYGSSGWSTARTRRSRGCMGGR